MLQGLDLQQHYNNGGGYSGYNTVVRRDKPFVDKSQYRCSLINIEQSQDDELDAILGELSELETQFSKEIVQQDRKRSSDESSATTATCSIVSRDTVSGPVVSRDPNVSSGRNDSPDTDSAFCDNLSLLSSCSAVSGSNSSNNTDQSKKSSGVSSSVSNGNQTDQDAKIKAEKIKIAIEKIKEASVKKLFIKVFTSDGSAKSLLVDEKMTVGNVTRILAEKNHVSLDPKWALVELVPDLYMERVYEDHEMLVENCLLWKVDSKNTLWFIERPEKFDLFIRPEIYLLGSSSSERDDSMEDHCRQELVEEYFSSTGVGAPQMEGYIWLKSESKKSWKKFHFILRTSGLYYSPKGKKTSKDLLCLCTFDVNQVYYGVGWKRKFKAPTDFCFGIKHPQIQAKNPKYIRYLCVDTQKELHQWVTGIRMAKNGRHLHDNYRGLVEEITHADIDILMGKRGSTNSAMCLVGPAKAESCATNLNLNLHSPATSPLSENKSFDSALSSGIRSDHYLETVPSSSSDLAKFDLKINESRSSSSPSFAGVMPLRRTSKSSSSLSDKSSGFEQGFESDHPAGGTIKKRPPHTPQSHMVQCSPAQEVSNIGDCDTDTGTGPMSGHHHGNIRIGAGGTLLRRTHSAESDRLNSGKNYEELQQLLDELHTNVKQAKDIQAKLKNALPHEEQGVAHDTATGFPPPCPETPPPPPLRTSSRLSMDEELLPPPPPELQTSAFSSAVAAAHNTSTLPRKKLPPIAPKPNLTRVPGSPKFKHSYGTLPNPVKKSAQSKVCNNDQKYKSGRRISFDDNIQLIDDQHTNTSSVLSGAGAHQPKPSNNDDAQMNPAFIQGLDKFISQRLPPPHSPHPPHHLQHHCPSAQTKNYPHGSHGSPHCSEPLYTAVVKPGSCHTRPRHYAPGQQSPCSNNYQRMRAGAPIPGSPSAMSKVCCVGSVRCQNSSGDSSPEQNTYRSWRSGAGESGDYWQAETSHNQIWPPRSCSEEKTSRPCDDINTKPRHNSVPSSPIQSSTTSRLWGSFRGKKPPTIDKRTLNPYLKTAS